MGAALKQAEWGVRPSRGNKAALRRGSPHLEERVEHAVYRWQYNPRPRRGASLATIRGLGGASPEYVRAVTNLIDLLDLPGGWNSYGARPIRRENVQFAVALLARLMREGTPAPQVVPKASGGVQLEWHMEGADVEVDISSPRDVGLLAEDARGQLEPLEGDLDEQALRPWIDRLSG